MSGTADAPDGGAVLPQAGAADAAGTAAEARSDARAAVARVLPADGLGDGEAAADAGAQPGDAAPRDVPDAAVAAGEAAASGDAESAMAATGAPLAGRLATDAPSADAAGTDPADGHPPERDDALDPALLSEGARIAEALIFASDRPVTPAMLGAVLPPGVSPGAVVTALAAACEGRGVTIAEVAGGWAFRTAPDLAQRLTRVVQAPRRLPRAAMEALSIIAYHQPCTRGEIEEIRGAALAQTTLEALLELGLVAPRGRREVPGRPTLWGTTPRFLEQFGLKALSDLPRKEELVTAETGPALPLAGPTEPAGEPVAEWSAAEEAAPTGGDNTPGAAP